MWVRILSASCASSCLNTLTLCTQGPALPGRETQARESPSALFKLPITQARLAFTQGRSPSCASMQGSPWPDCTLSHHPHQLTLARTTEGSWLLASC